MKEFSQKAFRRFLEKLQARYNNFISFNNYVYPSNQSFPQSLIILRHDVDRLPKNALKIAKIEYSLGINGSYYFRIEPESYDIMIMNEIMELGHEIGYHYEDVDLINSKLRIQNGELFKKDPEKYRELLIDLSYDSFCKNLEMFRKNFDVKTICMHGSPKSKYDNRIIWGKYNYKELGLAGEPYFDIDFNEVAYFTDTGRRWNGSKFSVRDKVSSKYNFDFKSTHEIIDNINNLPDKVMFTIHPERWNDSLIPWAKELLWQNMKNVVKRVFVHKAGD